MRDRADLWDGHPRRLGIRSRRAGAAGARLVAALGPLGRGALCPALAAHLFERGLREVVAAKLAVGGGQPGAYVAGVRWPAEMFRSYISAASANCPARS